MGAKSKLDRQSVRITELSNQLAALKLSKDREIAELQKINNRILRKHNDERSLYPFRLPVGYSNEHSSLIKIFSCFGTKIQCESTLTDKILSLTAANIMSKIELVKKDLVQNQSSISYQKAQKQVLILQKKVDTLTSWKNKSDLLLSKTIESERKSSYELNDLIVKVKSENKTLSEENKKLKNSLKLNEEHISAADGNETKALVEAKTRLEQGKNREAVLMERIQHFTSKLSDLEKIKSQMKAEDDKALENLKATLNEKLITEDRLQKKVTKLTSTLQVYEQAQSVADRADSEEVSKLRKMLSESQSREATRAMQLEKLVASQKESKSPAEHSPDKEAKEIMGLKAALNESQEKEAVLTKQVAELHKSKKADNEALARAKQKNVQPVGRLPTPVAKDDVRGYALGILWGQEVTNGITKVKATGITLNLEQVVSGVTDAINNRIRLPKAAIIAELDNVNRQVKKKNVAPATAVPNDDRKFIKSFLKKPGASRAKEGYYYRVINKGTDKINKNDVVSIQVKEQLSSGKVIHDMAKTEQVITLPLKDLPPLFASALSHVNNNGKLVIVVPPHLAYGEKGRPPEIPPSSTMMYEINVLNVTKTTRG